MKKQKPKNFNLIRLATIIIFITFFINPILGGIFFIIGIIVFAKTLKFLSSYLTTFKKTFQSQNNLNKNKSVANLSNTQNSLIQNKIIIPTQISTALSKQTKLEKQKKYLHIALNSTLQEAQEIISQLPISDRILIEVGTPLIKIYGTEAISQIKSMTPIGTYIIADSKCADLATREVEMMANAGANAATCLGVAPIETIDSFIEECQKFNIDSIIDMMNVENALTVLKKLKKLPNVVMLHRGADESEFSKEKQIPFYQIKQIKGNYNILVAIAGGDSIKEVQRAIFNDADIVVVWKNFYQPNSETAKLAESFLKEIK